MKKLTQFAVISAGTLILALILSACSNKWDRASKIILETLEERYGEEFVIEKMGGSWGTSDDSTIKAYVYPVSDETKRFQAQIKKKRLSKVTDEYMPFIVAEKLETKLSDVFKDLYPNLIVHVRASDLPTDDGGLAIDLKQYMDEHRALSYVIKMFVESNEQTFDKAIELSKVLNLIQEYNKLNYKETIFDIYYVDSDLFNQIPSEVETIDNVYGYYTDQEGLINHLYINMEKFPPNEIELTTEDFLY